MSPRPAVPERNDAVRSCVYPLVDIYPNTSRRFGSADEYLLVRVCECGEEARAAFTRGELVRAIGRAARNPEDWPEGSEPIPESP